ncbi:MAG: hypothetical protein U1F10_11645 [Burkholderiales bacterium]
MEAPRALCGIAWFAFALVGAAIGGDLAGAGGLVAGAFAGELLALGVFTLLRKAKPGGRLQ